MQIVESAHWAVRTARLCLTGPQTAIQVTLFPMLHIGESEFFRTVYQDAFSHDVVLVEGVRSPIARRITRSYRWIAKSKSLGLIVQPRYPSSAGCHAEIVDADLSHDEFRNVWRDVPLWQRALIFVACPIVGIQLGWFGSRERLAKGLSLDDLLSREEALNFGPETVALTRAILHARDRRLIARLKEKLDDPRPEMRRLAIVYGARHMRAVLRELTDRDYHVERAEWLTVFSLPGRPGSRRGRV
jgi:hypothetical protein